MDKFVWKVSLVKFGRKKVFKELTFIASSFFELAHIVAEEVFESDMFDFGVEVVKMEKIAGLGKVVNFYDDEDVGEYDPRHPIEIAKNLPDDRTMTFKCVCREQIRVVSSMWPYIKCPNCSNKIYRREVNDVGGIVIYSRIDELHRGED